MQDTPNNSIGHNANIIVDVTGRKIGLDPDIHNFPLFQIIHLLSLDGIDYLSRSALPRLYR